MIVYNGFADNMKEDFIDFTNITGNTTGENIADNIIDKLESFNLNPSYIRAQAYDGTGIRFIFRLNTYGLK